LGNFSLPKELGEFLPSKGTWGISPFQGDRHIYR
jgi:hypothetical protein